MSDKPKQSPDRFVSVHMKAPASELDLYRKAAARLFDGNLSMFLRRAARELAERTLTKKRAGR